MWALVGLVPTGCSSNSRGKLRRWNVRGIYYQVIYSCSLKNVCKCADPIEMPYQSFRILTMAGAQTCLQDVGSSHETADKHSFRSQCINVTR